MPQLCVWLCYRVPVSLCFVSSLPGGLQCCVTHFLSAPWCGLPPTQAPPPKVLVFALCPFPPLLRIFLPKHTSLFPVWLSLAPYLGGRWRQRRSQSQPTALETQGCQEGRSWERGCHQLKGEWQRAVDASDHWLLWGRDHSSTLLTTAPPSSDHSSALILFCISPLLCFPASASVLPAASHSSRFQTSVGFSQV